MGYCTVEEVRARLGAGGVRFVSEEGGTDNSAAVLSAAVDYSTSAIDQALCLFFNGLPPTTSNDWLRYRALDLAVEYAMRQGGGEPTASAVLAAERARADIAAVAAGRVRVPGLFYPIDRDVQAQQRAGRPAAYLGGGKVWRPNRR